MMWAVCLSLSLTWSLGPTQAAVYRYTGACVYQDTLFLPRQTFFRGCDKCYCHQRGFVCFSPQKPTSWPGWCRRVSTACGYRVVYQERPERECRAYSWIG